MKAVHVPNQIKSHFRNSRRGQAVFVRGKVGPRASSLGGSYNSRGCRTSLARQDVAVRFCVRLKRRRWLEPLSVVADGSRSVIDRLQRLMQLFPHPL